MPLDPLLKKRWTDHILVLGGGYIGTQVTKYFSDLEYPVICIDSRTVNYHDPTILTKFILNNSIGLVVNCSGFTGRPNVDEGELKKEECWNLNVVSPVLVAEACNYLNVKLIHISSGCIYSGYSKDFVEEDPPNFGMFDESSFYSKSKHAFETLTRRSDIKILRIRMPICLDVANPRNFINKIMKYPNLIDYQNSKTYIPDLCGFIDTLINAELSWVGQDIYNVVNPESLTTKEMVNILNQDKENYFNIHPYWVDIGDLNIIAPRSNCVLNGNKASKLYEFLTETQALWSIINHKNGIQAT